jgi:hypothetical protein
VKTTAVRGRGGDLLTVAEQDADTLGVAPGTVRRFLVLPWVGAALVAGTALYRPLFRLLTKEDRILEWAQFVALVLAAVVIAKVAVHLRREGRLPLAVVWGLFAVGCVVIAGEEIAWGQRVLGLETPAALDEVNHQGQITAHNIRGVQDAINLVFTAVGLYGSVVAGVLRWRARGAPSTTVRLLTPPLFLGSLFLIVAGYKAARLLFLHEARFIVVKYGEYAELCLAVGFLAFGWYTLRWLRERAAAGEPLG